MSERPTFDAASAASTRRARALSNGCAEIERVGDRIEHRLGRHVGFGRMQRRRELDVVGAQLARERDPFLDGAVGIGIADLARRQLLQRGRQDADFHELGENG